jgi:hypothetical protein
MMNSFLLRRLIYCLTRAGLYLEVARGAARCRKDWFETTCLHSGLIDRLRDRLHETAKRAVKFAGYAWLLLKVETLRANYQLTLFPL